MSADAERDTDYCRAVESYLCRKNDGHLIRLVGPAFECVCGWADRGVPLKVVYRGIDRYFERYYAKGRRRRPVRIEFCEADVLDVFDEWRRAVGVSIARERPDDDAMGAGPSGDADAEGGSAGRGRTSLAAHLDRVIARLLTLHTTGGAALGERADAMVQEIEAMRGSTRALRGPAREAMIDRLAALDRELLGAARTGLDEDTLRELHVEAMEELAPFQPRMVDGEHRRALEACLDRIVRERLRLPLVRYE